MRALRAAQLRPFGRALAVWGLALITLFIWWNTIRPSNDRDWQPDVARLARVEVLGEQLTFHNVRNFDYRQRPPQKPLYGVQGHLLHTFSANLWAALDANYYTGGRTSVNGATGNDLQENSRWGATLAHAFDRNNSIKLYFNSGVTARSGTNFNAAGIAWQYRWGAGL